MKQKTLLPTVLIFSFIFNFFLLHAQNNREIYVKPLQQTYEWNEKVMIEFAGLPQRDAYSGRVDDVIVVPAGTPDGEYGLGQRVWVSKPSGQVEFLIPKAGLYEARIYLYEKPGIVSARSSAFKVLSVEEGNLETKPDEALVQIANRSRGSNKTLMCQAVSEYFRRKPAAGHPNYTGMKALQSLCPKAPEKKSPAPVKTAFPIKARYQCYRLLITGNEVAEDIFILNNNEYKTMNKVGKYSYNSKTRMLTFTSGPLYVPSEKWVGVYTGKGEPTGNGGRTKEAIIEIRKKADVEAGNRKVLQQCSCVQ